MKASLKAVFCLFSLFLSGCYVDINFVGKGQVVADDIDCSRSCIKKSIGELVDTELKAIPAPGFSFIGFVGNGGAWHIGISKLYVEYGIAWIKNWYDAYPRLVQLQDHVTAIFWPEDDVRQSANTSNSICMIDQSSGLHCWGKSAKK
ncbi:MAG TPA: hypothetical protein VM553_01930, partial [Dongiaceae bacterium]|nr:hypothetical protein [Dongiaceae bacterium]